MLNTTRLSTTVILGLLWSGVFPTWGHAQAPVPDAAPPPPCGRPRIRCPAPIATDTFVHIIIEPDSNAVCRFNPRIIQDLNASHGDNIAWSFCSTCPTDMQVQLDVPGGNGPFDRFMAFVPMPTADNLVSVEVPCNAYGHASGFSATGSGDWKYFLRARPAGTLAFLDEIDPRLEIDDRTLASPRPVSPWLERLLFLIGGLLAGAYLMHRKSSRPR